MCFIYPNVLTEIVQTHLWLVGVNCRQINWTRKCTKLQMTALWDVWKQFPRPAQCCSVPRYTSRLSTIRVVKWDRCWGLERPQWDIENDGLAGSCGTIKGRDGERPGFYFHLTRSCPGTCSTSSEMKERCPLSCPTLICIYVWNKDSQNMPGENEDRQGLRTLLKPRRSVSFKH